MTKRTRAANAAALPIEKPIGADPASSAAAILAAAQASEDRSTIDADAALLALQQPWQDLRAAFERKPKPHTDAMIARQCKAEDKIVGPLVDMPARTLAGLGFKAKVSEADGHMNPELVASVMDDIAAMTAAPTAQGRFATFGDYAAGEFEAVAKHEDLDQLRPVYEQNWTPLALAMTILAKSSGEVAEFAEDMEKEGEGPLLTKLIENIAASSKWFAQTAELMDTAQIRMMCGMCRSYEAKGLPAEGL